MKHELELKTILGIVLGWLIASFSVLWYMVKTGRFPKKEKHG